MENTAPPKHWTGKRDKYSTFDPRNVLLTIIFFSLQCSLAPKVEDCQHTVFFVVRLIVIELQLKIKSTILPAQPVLTNYHEHRQKTWLGRKLSKLAVNCFTVEKLCVCSSLHVLCHRSCCISISFQGVRTVPGNQGAQSQKSWNRVQPQPTVFFFANYFYFPFNKTPKSVNWTKITLLYLFFFF